MLVIEWLLIPGSILELAVRRYAHQKVTLSLFLFGPSSLPVVVAQLDERLANRTKKELCLDMVRQTQSAWFIQTNELKCWKSLKCILTKFEASAASRFQDIAVQNWQFCFYFVFSFPQYCNSELLVRPGFSGRVWAKFRPKVDKILGLIRA